MTNKANLGTRVRKAKAASQFIGEIGNGKNVTYRVPGTNGKAYRVKVRRNGFLSVQCWLEADGSKCKGNSHNGTICYHAMAACFHLANGADKSISWCADRDDAVRLSSLGGKVFRVKSHDGNGMMWGVTK